MQRLLAVAVIVTSTTALARASLGQESSPHEPGEKGPRFLRLDVDGDGALSRDELFMIASARFEQLDQDNDGVLTAEEFKNIDADRDPQTRFQRLDTDGDGRIHKDELPEHMRASFEKFDTNGDDFVDEDEVKRLALSMREARNGPTALMRRLMELDIDGDGRLHRDELPEAMEYLRSQFDEFDVNGDDYIDGAELRAMTEATQRRPWRYQR